MVERHTEDLELALRIDPDDLDSCLVAQPGLFYQVAESVVLANSRRDALKLELEEAQAELDHQLRKEAIASKIKLTETMIENEIVCAPKIKQLQREYLDLRTKAEHCSALKEAYHQRSFMLREEVALQLAHFHNLQVERGAASSRHQLGDNIRQRQEQRRRERVT